MKDIRQFAVETAGTLHLRDGNDELMYADAENQQPITVDLYGPGSKQHARAQAAVQNRMMDRMKRKGKSDLTAEQKLEEDARFLADCTKGFSNLEYDQLTGDALFMAVYMDKTLGFIADQAAKFIGDWANFTRASTKA